MKKNTEKKDYTMIRARFSLLLCAAILCIKSPGFAEPSAKEVLNRYVGELGQMRSFECEFVLDQVLARKPNANDVNNVKKVNLKCDVEKTFCDIAVFSKDTKALIQREIDIWDGEYCYVLRKHNWMDSNQRPDLGTHRNKPPELLFGPRHVYLGLGFFSTEIQPFAKFRAILEGSPVALDQIDGKSAYLLQGRFEMKPDPNGNPQILPGDRFTLKIWFSTEHYLPVQHELSFEGAKRRDRVTKVKYARFGDRFFPVHAVRETFDPEVSHTYVAELEKTKVNSSIPADTFKPELVPGTFIWDYVMGNRGAHNLYLNKRDASGKKPGGKSKEE